MKSYIYNSTVIFQTLIFCLIMYYLILSLFGLWKKDKDIQYKPKKSFALIVAAHNEEMVISKIIESLLDQNYPKQLYDIFIIADNCCDKTAALARKYGVNVYERYNNEERGKGYALQWMFDKLFKLKKKYDAVGIFDADNVVSSNFLKEMNNKLMCGYKVVQGYIDSKNPHDSWITESYSISFWSSNRLFQMARSNLNLSNQIGGTGFVVECSLLKKLGWGVTCLTEDLEFTCKLVLNNAKVGWAHNAIVYDEKPITLRQSWNQRKRWMQGFTDVSSRFFIKLINKALRENDAVALDCALYVIQPFVTLGVGVSLLLTFIQNNSKHGLNIFTIEYLFPVFVWKLFSIFQFMITPIVLALEKKIHKKLLVFLAAYSANIFLFSYIFDKSDKLIVILFGHLLYLIVFCGIVLIIDGKKSARIFIYYLLYSIYTLTWIPITIQGIVNKNKKEWNHTKHVRQIGISEI